MKLSWRGFWFGWLLPIVLGATAGLAARAYSPVGNRKANALAAARGPEPTAPEKPPDPRPVDATRSRAVGADEPVSLESLEEVIAEIAALEQQIGKIDPAVVCVSGDCQGWFEPDEETLQQWAACAQLPVDLPSALFRGDGTWFSDQALASVDVSEDEKQELARVAEEYGQNLHQRIVSLHEEIVGTGQVDSRPTHALIGDLRAMQAVVDPDGLDRRRVALERAGQPPPEGRGSAEIVPFYRELLQIGDDLESKVADVLGKQRAHALRRHGNGWGARLGDPPMCE